jgi:hypothetical protein
MGQGVESAIVGIGRPVSMASRGVAGAPLAVKLPEQPERGSARSEETFISQYGI